MFLINRMEMINLVNRLQGQLSRQRQRQRHRNHKPTKNVPKKQKKIHNYVKTIIIFSLVFRFRSIHILQYVIYNYLRSIVTLKETHTKSILTTISDLSGELKKKRRKFFTILLKWLFAQLGHSTSKFSFPIYFSSCVSNGSQK